MKITTRQKLFLGLLCVGLLALGIDRAFFEGGPRRASAAVSGSAAAPAVADAPADMAVPAAAEPGGVVDRLGDRLRSIPLSSAGVIDAFATSTAWRAASHPAVAVVVDSSGVEFAAKHRLSAVLASGGGGGVAIVDGVTIRRGQRFDGFVLTDVQPRRVRFATSRMAVDLTLAP